MSDPILLTGASGFLGRHIAEQFSQQSIAIATLGRSSNSQVRCDLAREVPDFTGHRFSLVVHAAGKAHSVPTTEEEAKEFAMVNLTGTEHLLQGLAAMAVKPEHFFFISTVAVYGLTHGEDIAETQPLAGDTPYASSKIMAEQKVQEWCNRHGVKAYILRLPLIAGKGAPGNLEAMVSGIRKGRYWNIGGGQARKSMVMAGDVASAIVQMQGYPGIYHLTDGQHPSFSDLASVMASQLGKPSPGNLPMWLARLMAIAGDFLGKKAPINSDKLAKITATLTFSDEKARSVWGWKPTAVLTQYKI